MADPFASPVRLPRRVKVLGTCFLVFQLLFALNNYGPQRVPGLRLVFDRPFVAARAATSPAEASTVWLEDVTARAGLDRFRRAPFYDADPNYLEVMGGGIAVGDYDGDGYDDLFLTSLPAFDPASRPASSSTLFRSRGDGTFEDVTRAAGLDRLGGYPQGALFADFDNDGDQDLYVAAYGGGRLFRNEGGTFTDVTQQAGLSLDGRCGSLPCFGSSASAADYDRDGWLDLLVVNNVGFDLDDPAQRGSRNLFPAFHPAQESFLFRNRGDGTFADVSAESGLDNRDGKGLAAVWLDVNDDRWPDVYVANDLSHNTLYLNRGDGTFIEFGAGAGLDEVKSSMGVAAADVDHDGDMDLVTTNLKGSKVSFFENAGDLRFLYATDQAGLGASTRASGWGVAFVDLDLDGHPDLVVSGGPVWEREPADTQNLVFRNLGSGRFADVTETSGVLYGRAVSRGLAVLDADGSGTPDLLFANADDATPALLRNQLHRANRWLQVRLEGTASNRDGVGARVVLDRADGLRQVQEVRAGGSYQSASTRTLFFGLGQSSPEALSVHWPSGAVDTLRQLPADALLLVREGGSMQVRTP